jgi:uncharacterized protein
MIMTTLTNARMKRHAGTKKRAIQALPVVHFEIVGKDPRKLRAYYGKLFGWKFDTNVPVAEAISQPGNYGFIGCTQTSEGVGIPGGIGGGPSHDSHTIFYIGVSDVEAALKKAESLGGKRQLGPVTSKDAKLAVGHFLDPEGHLIGVAGPAKDV